MQIQIYFYSPGISLPMNYQYHVQSMIYHAASEDPAFSAFLHDMGYTYGSRQYRLFTFGRLEGRYSQDNGRLVFADGFILRIRSINARLIQILLSAFSPLTSHLLCRQVIEVQDCLLSDQHILTENIDIVTCSPIVAYRSSEQKRKDFYSPLENDFYDLLSDNAERKWMSYYGSPAPGRLAVSPMERPYKKVVTRYKGAFITGWMGRFHARGPIPLLDFIYLTGLGAKSSQGFGMFDVWRAGC